MAFQTRGVRHFLHLTAKHAHKTPLADKPVPPRTKQTAIDSFERNEEERGNIRITKPTANRKTAIHNFHACPDRPIYESEIIFLEMHANFA